MFKLTLDNDVTFHLLPDTGIKTVYYNNALCNSSFKDVDVAVAKHRFNKMRGYFYLFHEPVYLFHDPVGGTLASLYGEFYACEVNDVRLGMFFRKDGAKFYLQIGEELFEFETNDNWIHSDVEVVGKNFPILEEFMEFIADYYEL